MLPDVLLRFVGAFYVFAGFVATRAALTSHLMDRALAAISGGDTSRRENARTAWLVGSAGLVLAGGVALALLLDLAPWFFMASSAGQLAYLAALAPRYFDVEDPPDATGRRQTINAFMIYLVATAIVLWAWHAGRLSTWHDLPAALLAVGACAVLAWLAYVVRYAMMPVKSAPGWSKDDQS